MARINSDDSFEGTASKSKRKTATMNSTMVRGKTATALDSTLSVDGVRLNGTSKGDALKQPTLMGMLQQAHSQKPSSKRKVSHEVALGNRQTSIPGEGKETVLEDDVQDDSIETNSSQSTLYSDSETPASNKGRINPMKQGKTTKGGTKKSKNPKVLHEISSTLSSAHGALNLYSNENVEEYKNAKTLEQIYQKKSQLEHILLRPDTYIGSVEQHTEHLWVFNEETQGLEHRPIHYVPGFYKIFDEILVNAADNKIRDPTMDTIKVTIDKENNLISVFNNGCGVPIQIHKEENIHVPELIFGHLLTSSNYDDKEKKVTGGRNGYGAKLCNIFSTEFIVETADRTVGKKFKQIFTRNMTEKSLPMITNYTKEDFTKITFKPDLEKFHIQCIDSDHEALLKKRVYDVAGTVRGVKVYLNDQRIHVKSFKQYVELIMQSLCREKEEKEGAKNLSTWNEEDSDKELANELLNPISNGLQRSHSTGSLPFTPSPLSSPSMLPIVFESFGDRWEVAVALSDGQFQQISFVNSICTSKGGTHVNHVVEQIISKILENVNKKTNKTAQGIKPFQVKNQMSIFINCLIENPSFDSQTKEHMTLRVNAFGSKCEVTEDFLKKVIKQSGIVEQLLSFAQKQQSLQLKKTDGSKTTRIMGISKLDDANKAGTRESDKCTLILTEGDSAKALAVSGLSVVGRDHYGVFPLRGKLLNVREASHKQILENAEINFIKQILGLQQGKEYASVASLRYGHIMVMTDQDHDGSHIKGLIINILDHFWPSLLKIPQFLLEFITPIVKATRNRSEISFFTLPEYHRWKEQNNNGRGWTIKYYKGLGTSTSVEARRYFSDLERHRKQFAIVEDIDRQYVDMAFSKKKADERKEWLRQYIPGTFIDHNVDEIRIRDFINQELVLFSMADNVRCIPSMVDGLKPGQRKVLFACFKRNLRNEIKVAQLAGYVAEHSAYHHGEQSLCATIVNMSQTFVGSNNVNTLMPIGQFGTRIQGGKDAASARYIFTCLNPLTRMLFHIEDDRLLDYLNEDGQSIEPTWYIPILPTVLVNGGDGIGTGWSTSIPNFNPGDIALNLLRMMNGEELKEMHPWYRNYRGSIEPVSGNKYRVLGVITKVDDCVVEITELPIGVWTQTYKEWLETLLDSTSTNGTGRKRRAGEPETNGASGLGTRTTVSEGTDNTQDALRNNVSSITSSPSDPSFSIVDFREYHTDTRVHFVITLTRDTLHQLQAYGDLHKSFKLISTLNLSNMVCFDSQGRIQKYNGCNEILSEFYQLRLEYYQKRKQHLVDQLTREWNRLDNQVRFVQEVIDGHFLINNRKRDELLQDLHAHSYALFEKESNGNAPIGDGIAGPLSRSTSSFIDDQVDMTKNDSRATLFLGSPSSTPPLSALANGYDYLLSMPFWSLTTEKIAHLVHSRNESEQKLNHILSLSPKQLWKNDLQVFIEEWNQYCRQLSVEEHEENHTITEQRKKTTTKKPPLSRKTSEVEDRKGKVSRTHSSNAPTPSCSSLSDAFKAPLKSTLSSASDLSSIYPRALHSFHEKENVDCKLEIKPKDSIPVVSKIPKSNDASSPIFLSLSERIQRLKDTGGTQSLSTHTTLPSSVSDHPSNASVGIISASSSTLPLPQSSASTHLHNTIHHASEESSNPLSSSPRVPSSSTSTRPPRAHTVKAQVLDWEESDEEPTTTSDDYSDHEESDEEFCSTKKPLRKPLGIAKKSKGKK